MPCGGRCRRNGLGVFGFNGRTPSIVAQCHSEGVLLPHLRHVAVVVPSQCGFRPRPMRGGCRRRRPVPNRLSLMISYYDTPVRFVLFDSAVRVGTLPGRHATHKEGERRTTASFFLLPPSAGLPGAPVVPRQLFSLRKNSVIEIIRSPSLLFLCVCFIPISGCACRRGCCDSPSVGAGLLSPRRFCGSPGCSIRCGPRHRRR